MNDVCQTATGTPVFVVLATRSVVTRVVLQYSIELSVEAWYALVARAAEEGPARIARETGYHAMRR